MRDLTDQQVRLFEQPNIGNLATIRRDGTANLTPVWVDWDGRHVLVNTAIGRAKEKHLRRDPRATIGVVNPEDRYDWVSVTGPVELVEEGAEDHIDRLAKKYLGKDVYPSRSEGERRVTVRITPERVSSGRS